MDRPDVTHSDADLTAESDSIGGLYTTIPNLIPRNPPAQAAQKHDSAKPLSELIVEKATPFAAFTSLAASILTLIGWAFDVEVLRSILPGHAPMKPNTALGIGLCATGLLLLRENDAARWKRAYRIGGRIAAGLALVLGLLTLSQFVTGRSLGIDDFHFGAMLSTMPMAYSGRMSPVTAITLAATAASILLISYGRFALAVAEIAAVLVAALAIVSILGYIFDASSLYATDAFRSVAIHTAISFFLLSAGILFSRRSSPVSVLFSDPGPAGILMRRLVPVALIVPALIGWLCLSGQRMAFYGAELGLALFASSSMVVFGFFIWRSALAIARADEEVALRESRLQRSRDHLELALEAGEIAAWDLDLATQTVKRTPRYDRIMGYASPLPVWTVADFVRQIHPDDVARYLKVFAERSLESGNKAIEVRIIRPDGEVRNIWSVGRRIASDEGQERMTGVMMDISDLRRAQKELQQIFERITDAFVAVDRKFDFVYVNSNAASMLQRTASDLLGKNMWDEFPEGFSSGFRRAYESALRNQTAVVHEEFYPPLERWIEVRVFPSPEGLSIYFHDVTDRKNTENRIRELNQTLEQRVVERTRELENVNRELEAFSYSVSHDLRAPLRAIDGFSAAVVEDFGESLDPEALGYLDRVRRASKHMGMLIDDLLKLSRVSRADMKRSEIDISALAEHVADRLRESEPTREVEVKIQPKLKAFGDDVLVRSVLENLLGNAWKFTSKKTGGQIEFGLTDHNGRQMFFVRDNGAGFDMTYRDKLFGAFQRLHPPAEFEGTGIGLATVQRIVNRHGGIVDAAGATGSGATFYFSLGDKDGHY